ncbi:uncharacterized protein [Ptychodera flava]|uniref:uncharacterized protein n=1 Tax=Ptychodera flava TaxID=63121 RepID=UPI00396A564E
MRSCTNHPCKGRPGPHADKMAGSGCSKGLGKALILLGSLSMILGIASIPVCMSEIKYLGAPIWSGFFIIVTGFVGVMSTCRKRTNAWLTSFLVLSVIAVIVVFTAWVWTATAIRMDMKLYYDDDYESYSDEDYFSDSGDIEDDLRGWLHDLEDEEFPHNFDDMKDMIPDSLEEVLEEFEELKDMEDGEWEEWIDDFMNEGSKEEEYEGEWEGEEDGDEAETRARSGHGRHRPRPGGHHETDSKERSHENSEDWHEGEDWFGWHGSDGDSYEEKKEEDELKSSFRTSIAMFSVTMILAFVEVILVFAAAVSACCGLCKTPSHVAPQQVVVLQPGQKIMPGADGQFVLINAGQEVGTYHSTNPAMLSTDFTPSTNPALTVKPSGLPHGRLPPLATAPTYEEAVALPPKEGLAPGYYEAEELPTKISL